MSPTGGTYIDESTIEKMAELYKTNECN